MRNPTFTVYTGPMFSGKSSKLIAYLDRCKYQHRTFVAFKPAADDRYGTGFICTHSGGRVEAVNVTSGSDITRHLVSLEKLPDVVALDEAWMVKGAATHLIEIFKLGVSVVVSSIDLLANGKELQEVQRLMSWATHVEKCPAACSVCGLDAFYTHMKIADDRDVAIGGEDLYEARCWHHTPMIQMNE